MRKIKRDMGNKNIDLVGKNLKLCFIKTRTKFIVQRKKKRKRKTCFEILQIKLHYRWRYLL